MAVRPIDANELCRIEKLLDTDIVRQDKVALNLLEQVLYDIQHVPTLTPPNEWVSVEDRLPTDERPVLVFVGYPDSMIGFITTSSYFCFDPKPHWQWDGLVRDEQRTLFWMPLPEPPDRRPPEGARMNTFTLPGTDGIFIQGKLYSKKKLCLDWFKMSNDNFYNLYGFNFNPHDYPGLYDWGIKTLYGE